MSSSLTQFNIRYPDISFGTNTFVSPFVYATLTNDYTISNNDTLYIGKASDSWEVVEDSISSFNASTQTFTCNYEGRYQINTTIRDAGSNITTWIEITEPGQIPYIIRSEQTASSDFTRNMSYVTPTLPKDTLIKCRLQLNTTGTTTIYGKTSLGPSEVINSSFSICYHAPTFISSSTTNTIVNNVQI